MAEKTVLKEEYEKLKKWYSEELKRRDKIIDGLKKDLRVLMNSALKQSEKRNTVTEHFNKIAELNKKLKQKLRIGK